MILVVTDTHQPRDAREVLERILTIDRADIPATTQRRQLAATVPRTSAPTCRGVRSPTGSTPSTATPAPPSSSPNKPETRNNNATSDSTKSSPTTVAELDRLEPLCAPHDALIDTAKRAVSELQDEQRRAHRNLADTGRLGRHRARTHLDDTTTQLTAAEQLLEAPTT